MRTCLECTQESAYKKLEFEIMKVCVVRYQVYFVGIFESREVAEELVDSKLTNQADLIHFRFEEMDLNAFHKDVAFMFN